MLSSSSATVDNHASSLSCVFQADLEPQQQPEVPFIDCPDGKVCTFIISSVTQLCLTLCNPTDCSTPGLPVHHQLPEFTQTHVHHVSEAIRPFHPLLLLPSIFPSIRVFSNESVLASGGRSIGVSASALVLPMNIQDLFPLEWTGRISLHSKILSRVFSNTTVQKHQFFGPQLSLYSNSHNHM